MDKIKDFFIRNEYVVVTILVLAFIIIRLPGTDLPLHQDEYKWPMIVNPSYVSDTEIPHPPLSQFIYKTAGMVVGYDTDFRFVPLFFGVLNLLLLYYFLRIRFNRSVAIIGSLLFTLSYFSILASLMVDTDGQIMPFFFLLALIGYHKSKVSLGRKKYFWFGIMALGMILGFFIKVSFILAICAIIADFIWEKKSYITKKELLKYLGYLIAGVFSLTLLLVISQYVFSFFNLEKAFVYWKHFAELDRNWFQTMIQVVKAALYTSPFLICIPFFLSRNKARELRPFIFFILFGMIFYTIIFDFSIGALDRYLQFLIIPLCAISAVVIESVTKSDDDKRNKKYLFFGILLSFLIFLLLFVFHFVPSLHPKSEWVSRVLSLKWNFLYPFSGGSGPLGFYVSFLFIALSWIVSIIFLFIGLIKPSLRKMIIFILIPMGLIYNGVFAEEYLFGKIYGSSPRLLAPAVQFIKNNPDIKKVLVYNDNGGDEIRQLGKYERRIYAVPGFESTYETIFKNFDGHILYIDIPKVEKGSLYEKYFNSCIIIYSKKDKYITSEVLDCKK